MSSSYSRGVHHPQPREMRLTNKETGEVQDVLVTADRGGSRRAKQFGDSPWVIAFEDGLRAFCYAPLDRTDRRVFHAVASRSLVEKEDWPLDGVGIAAELSISPARVSRSVRKLVEEGLLLRPRRGWLAFPPDKFWRGDAQSRKAALVRQETGGQNAKSREAAPEEGD